MAIIIDLEEERRKRRKRLTKCSLCPKVLLTHEVQMVGDDAELFLLCSDCENALLERETEDCPECGREVFFLYKSEHFEKSCAVCLNDALRNAEGGREKDPSTPF